MSDLNKNKPVDDFSNVKAGDRIYVCHYSSNWRDTTTVRVPDVVERVTPTLIIIAGPFKGKSRYKKDTGQIYGHTAGYCPDYTWLELMTEKRIQQEEYKKERTQLIPKVREEIAKLQNVGSFNGVTNESLKELYAFIQKYTKK